MRKIFLILCMLGILAPPLCAAPPAEVTALFDEGNSYYSQEKFKEAAKAYEEITGLGYESGPLYYNLGNAYFKSGALGKAVLNYRRAERLEPLDADLKANLEYVISLVKQKSAAAESNLSARFFSALNGSFSLNSISAAYFTMFILLFLLAVSFILAGNIRRWLGYLCIPVIALFIITAAILGSKYYDTAAHKEAVIISQNTDCKFEPFDNSTTYFTLYEGEDVIVISRKGAWAKIRRPDNKQGWIKKEAMELL